MNAKDDKKQTKTDQSKPTPGQKVILPHMLDEAKLTKERLERNRQRKLADLKEARAYLEKTRALCKKGIVKGSAFQSIRATTKQLRKTLEEALKQSNAELREAVVQENNLKRAYAAQNPTDHETAEMLRALSAIKAHDIPLIKKAVERGLV